MMFFLSFIVMFPYYTPSKYDAMFNEKKINSNLNSTFKSPHETLDGTGNLTQRNIHTPSDFENKEIIETLPILTPFPPTTLQSTVSPSVGQKYSQIDYQTIRTKTKKRPPNKQRHPIGNNLAN